MMAARRCRKPAHNGNLGSTSLPRRRGSTDPMRAYDALPPELRSWVANAARPWSAASCLKLWRRALAEEGCPKRAIARLDGVEARLLARDAWVPQPALEAEGLRG